MAALPLAFFVVALALTIPASAQINDLDAPRLEAVLDLDHDGMPDRAVLSRQAGDEGLADLSIYFGAGASPVLPGAKADYVKTGLTADQVIWLEANGDETLLFVSSCGGCSNNYDTLLTIAYREKTFWVDGYRLDWDTQGGMGSCAIDLLGNKGAITQGLDDDERTTPVDGTFKPIQLADWTDDMTPKACQS